MAQDDRLAYDTETATGTGGPPSGRRGAAVSSASAYSPWTLRLVAVGLVLAALNLRPAVSGLGPLLEEVRGGLGMSGTVAGLLASMPAVCFAVFGSVAPRLARRWGPAAVVLAGMAAITAGLALRPLAGGTVIFLLTSAFALAGIAVSNVLMPVVVRRWFPHRVGTMTGLYSMALALGTSVTAALTVPMTQALGGSWRIGLGVWAVLGALALLPWTAVLLRDRKVRRAERTAQTAQTAGHAGSASEPATAGTTGTAADGDTPPVSVLRSSTAWALAVFFGLQATGAYVTMGWLPQMFRDAGVPASTAGLLLAVTMGVGVPISFVLPRLAARLGHQGPLVAFIGACGLGAYTGLWLAPAGGAWAWVMLLAVSNTAFPLVLTMIGMRARSSAGVAKLSAFVQSTGYLIAIPGPLVVGALRDGSGGWHAPLALMMTLMCVQIAVGVFAGRDRCVEDDC